MALEQIALHIPDAPQHIDAALLIVLGLALCFRGYRVFRVALPLGAFVLFSILTAAHAHPFVAAAPLPTLALAVAGGLLGTVLILGAQLYGFFALGALSGWSLGGLASAAIPGVYPAGIQLLCAVIGGVTAVMATTALIVCGTACYGAMMALSGLMHFTGQALLHGFPPRPVELAQAPHVVLLAWAITATAGVLHQYDFRHNRGVPGH